MALMTMMMVVVMVMVGSTNAGNPTTAYSILHTYVHTLVFEAFVDNIKGVQQQNAVKYPTVHSTKQTSNNNNHNNIQYLERKKQPTNQPDPWLMCRNPQENLCGCCYCCWCCSSRRGVWDIVVELLQPNSSATNFSFSLRSYLGMDVRMWKRSNVFCCHSCISCCRCCFILLILLLLFDVVVCSNFSFLVDLLKVPELIKRYWIESVVGGEVTGSDVGLELEFGRWVCRTLCGKSEVNLTNLFRISAFLLVLYFLCSSRQRFDHCWLQVLFFCHLPANVRRSGQHFLLCHRTWE